MLKNTDKGPLTFLRYGLPRTKELLKDISRVYDGIVVPSNILLYQYKSTPAIVYNLKQPFFSDPMSYLFAHPFERFKRRIEKGGFAFKPSFAKLLQGYGLEPSSFINNGTRLTDYLKADDKHLESFIDNCIKFQWNQVETTLQEAKELINVEDGSRLKPSFVVAPYFLYRNDDQESLLNFKILDYCSTNLKKWEGIDIFPMVFVERASLLHDNYVDDLITKLTKYTFNGYCVWIEDFDERYATTAEIVQFIKLVKGLAQTRSKQIVVLFGGFFSLLLYKYGVTCVCHGLLYSEHRAISASTSQTSGPAPIRYYLGDLHQFLTLEKSLTILRKRPDLICECPICQRIIQNNPENIVRFESEENMAIMHFLYKRYEEKNMIAKLEPKDIIDYLKYTSDLNKDITDITHEDKPIIDPICLTNWADAIGQVPNT